MLTNSVRTVWRSEVYFCLGHYVVKIMSVYSEKPGKGSAVTPFQQKYTLHTITLIQVGYMVAMGEVGFYTCYPLDFFSCTAVQGFIAKNNASINYSRPGELISVSQLALWAAAPAPHFCVQGWQPLYGHFQSCSLGLTTRRWPASTGRLSPWWPWKKTTKPKGSILLPVLFLSPPVVMTCWEHGRWHDSHYYV